MKKILSLSRASKYEYPPYQKYGPGTRDCYIIHYVTSGKGYFHAGGKMWEITGGRAFIIYQGETIEYYADKEDPWSYLWIDFSGEIAEKLIASTGFSIDNRVSPPLDNERMLEIFADFKNDFSSESAELEGISNFIKLISEISRAFPSDSYDENMGIAKRAKLLINRNYRSTECRVDEISEMLGISRSQLYRSFMEKYGISPKEYIDSMRIEIARTLIEKADLSVAQVCYSSGFTDPLYFSAVFKKKLLFSPSEYRRRYLKLNQKNNEQRN